MGTGASNAAEEILFIGTQQAYDALTPAQVSEIDYSYIVGDSFDRLQLSAGEDSSYRILPDNVTVFYESDVPALDFSATVTDADTDYVTTTPFTVTFEGGETLSGGALSDVLVGGSGSDALYGEGGNDTLVYDSNDSVIDGGTGTDTLVLAGDTDIDFTTWNSDAVKNIEIIDLTSGDHDLSNLSLNDVVNMTDINNDIYILGNGGDRVDFLNNDGWEISTITPTVTEMINGTPYTFDVYINSNDPTVMVKVEQAITDTI
jgi:Ca2+-binding RTX toxin-like protein